jgi:hypothetical protein
MLGELRRAAQGRPEGFARSIGIPPAAAGAANGKLVLWVEISKELRRKYRQTQRGSFRRITAMWTR